MSETDFETPASVRVYFSGMQGQYAPVNVAMSRINFRFLAADTFTGNPKIIMGVAATFSRLKNR